MATLLFILFIVYLLYLVNKSRKNSNYLKFNLVYILSFLMVYILPFFNKNSNQIWRYDESFILYLIICFIISIIIIELSTIKDKKVKVKYFINLRKVNLYTNLIIFYYVCSIGYFFLINGFDLINILFGNRVEAYLENIREQNFIISNLRNAINVLSIILIINLLREKKYKKAILFYLLILLYIFLTTHTRYILMTYLAMPVLYYHFYIKKIRIAVFGSLIIIGAIYLSVANFFRTGVASEYSLTDIINTEVVINQIEINSVSDFYVVYNKVNEGRVEIEYGKQYYYYFPLTFIPKSIWDDKPVVSYFWRMTKEVTGNWPGPRQFVLTSTFFGESYHQFHVLGILINFLIYFFLMRKLFLLALEIDYGLPIIWFLLIHIPMDIRGGLNSVLITFIFYFLLIFCLKKSNLIAQKNNSNNFLKLNDYI